MNNVICIYHYNCADGFTAAWVVHKVYPNATFHPGIYQNKPPSVKDKIVLMVDFSYKRPVLLEMAKEATHITILDHHQSAQKDLVDLPDNVTSVFDMTRSGAKITWDYFFPNQPAPQLLLHVQDRDLWKFELEGTREIQACMFSYPFDFIIWDILFDSDLGVLRKEGKAIERKHFKDIQEYIAAASYRDVIAGYEVPVLNAPYFWSSDAGHIMAKNEPFAACYWDTPEGRVYSLRSTDNGMDVAKIAEQFGGGGHAHAAGFRIPR